MKLSDVYVIGAGESKYGELWDRSLRDITVEAGLKAVESAGLRTKDLDIIYAGNSLGGIISKQEHLGALIADHAGLSGEDIPAIKIEASTASGAAAIHQAYMALKSGEIDVAMVIGAEKMTELYGNEMIDITSSILDREWESFVGGTPAAMAALSARLYMETFNVRREDLAKISINDHENASMNPVSHFKNKLSMKGALNSVWISEPLSLMDCAPMSDGASGIIMASENFVKREKMEGIKILASEMSQGSFSIQSREEIYTIDTARKASEKAFKKAGISPGKINHLELHNSYSIYGLMQIEDLGFAEKGKAKEIVESGIGINGHLPINSSGGLKAKGYPFGAVGVGQMVESYLQLMGKAGQRQIKGVERSLVYSMAGSGSASVVHITEV